MAPRGSGAIARLLAGLDGRENLLTGLGDLVEPARVVIRGVGAPEIAQLRDGRDRFDVRIDEQGPQRSVRPAIWNFPSSTSAYSQPRWLCAGMVLPGPQRSM